MVHVHIHGNLGHKPELTDAENPFVRFSIASNRRYKQETYTTWVRCKAFGSLAKVIAEHLDKGSEAVIFGRLDTYQFEKEGVKVHGYDVIVTEVDFCGSRTSAKSEEDASIEETQPTTGSDD
jgi:single-strand DNA-binding protein